MKENIKDVIVESFSTNQSRKAQENLERCLNYLHLDGSEDVKYLDTVSRWTGTGYRDQIYQIIGTDDAFIVCLNAGSAQGGTLEDSNYKRKIGFFEKRRAYARSCGEAARWYGLPFYLVLAIKPKRCELLMPFVEKVDRGEFWLSPEDIHELTECGISRRCEAMRFILGDELYDRLYIEEMGQTNNYRVAAWLADIARTCE